MMGKSSRYQWQGEPVKVRFGECRVTPNKEKPLYWYNYECYNNEFNKASLVAFVPAIEITCGDQVFVIGNHFGIGIHKVLNGGWPNHNHFSLPKETFELGRKKYHRITEFDLDEYSEHEAKRRAWQKENYPEEFERSEALRRAISKVFKDIEE